MSELLEDLSHSIRRARRNRAATAALVGVLGAGIGASLTSLGIADSLLLRPLPFPEPQRLVTVYEQNLARDIREMSVSYPSVQFWRERARTLEAVAAYNPNRPLTLVGAGEPVRLETNFVTNDYFELLGARAERGRLLVDDDHRAPMVSPVVVISHRLWRERFGGRGDIVGATLDLDGHPFTVVGVLDAGFRDLPTGDRPTEIWAPLSMIPVTGLGWELVDRRMSRWLSTVARVAPGASPAQVRAELDSLAEALEHDYPETHDGYRLVAQPLRDHLLGGLRPALGALIGASLFVLLIGCSNAAHLMLVRAAGARRQVAVELALGLPWRRLLRGLILDGLIVSVLAGGMGLVLARSLTGLLVRAAPVRLPAFLSVGLRPGFALAGLGLAGLVGLFFGLVPALECRRVDLRESLRGAGREVGSDRTPGRRLLIIVEVAAAVLLLAGALQFLRSLGHLNATGLGFDTDRLLVARTDLPPARYGDAEHQRSFARRALEALAAAPGVEQAIVWSPSIPGQAQWYTSFAAHGRAAGSLDDLVVGRYHLVSPGALRELGVPMLSGRGLEAEDGADASRVAVLSESAARALFPDADPLGGRFYRWRSPASVENEPRLTVVGIVRDVLQSGRTDATVGTIDVYLPYQQAPEPELAILLRGQDTEGTLAATVRRVVHELDGDLPLFDVASYRQRLHREVAQPRFSAYLVGAFAAIALLLAALGLYASIAHTVRLRAREVGIRIALGGAPLRVTVELALRTAALIGSGLALGLVALAGLGRFLSGQLYGVRTLDPMTLALVTVALGAVALLAGFRPLRRAARLDPVQVLRAE